MESIIQSVTRNCTVFVGLLRRKICSKIQSFLSRARIVLPAATRLVKSGLQTRRELRRHMPEEWISRHFPQLKPLGLTRSAFAIIPEIWQETSDIDTDQRVPTELRRIRKTLRQQPSSQVAPVTVAGRRVLQAAFARCAATVTKRSVPADIARQLRTDRCLRDLLLTWIDLTIATTVRPAPESLESALAVHGVFVLPPGSQLPPTLQDHLSTFRDQIHGRLQTQEKELQVNALKCRLLLKSNECLVLPMALAEGFRRKQNHVL